MEKKARPRRAGKALVALAGRATRARSGLKLPAHILRGNGPSY